MPSFPFAAFAVIPAAGLSRRMGAPKLLLPDERGTVIEEALNAWRESHVQKIVVVVRPDDHVLSEVCRQANVEVVVPDVSPPDMKDSIASALRHIERSWQPTASDVWLLAPADMPRLASHAIDQLLAAHDPASPKILQAAHESRSGHPVLFPWPLAEEVHGLAADEGVNLLVRRHGRRLVEVGDPGIFFDLDTPEDYRRLREG